MAHKLGLTGGILALAGLIGKFAAELYFDEHPIEEMLGSFVTQLGGDVSLRTQTATFFAEYGLIIAAVGTVLLVIAFFLRR